MKIRGINVPVNVRDEIESYPWENATWSHDKLIACSPFRNESHPSFFVRLTDSDGHNAGVWSDSGNIGGSTSGNFVQLLAHISSTSEEDAIEYLLEKYGIIERGYTRPVTVKPPRLTVASRTYSLDTNVLSSYSDNYSYLLSRGIPAHVQSQYGVKYDTARNAVVLPWKDCHGEVANIKYRSVRSKVFWYAKGATPIAQLMYGMDVIYKNKCDTAVLCEAEIDALTMAQILPAVALGGSAFNESKAELILKSSIKTLYLACDNDPVGAALNKRIAARLGKHINIRYFTFPDGSKDVNELREIEKIKNGIENAKNFVFVSPKLKF